MEERRGVRPRVHVQLHLEKTVQNGMRNCPLLSGTKRNPVERAADQIPLELWKFSCLINSYRALIRAYSAPLHRSVRSICLSITGIPGPWQKSLGHYQTSIITEDSGAPIKIIPSLHDLAGIKKNLVWHM